MKKYLALLVAFAFVAVQFVDVAVLDNEHLAAAEIHAQLNVDNEHAPECPDSCDIHSSCHMLHHMGPAGSAAELTFLPDLSHKFAFGQADTKGFTLSPPVPPPLA